MIYGFREVRSTTIDVFRIQCLQKDVIFSWIPSLQKSSRKPVRGWDAVATRTFFRRCFEPYVHSTLQQDYLYLKIFDLNCILSREQQTTTKIFCSAENFDFRQSKRKFRRKILNFIHHGQLSYLSKYTIFNVFKTLQKTNKYSTTHSKKFSTLCFANGFINTFALHCTSIVALLRENAGEGGFQILQAIQRSHKIFR